MIRLPDDYVVELARGMLRRGEYSEAVKALQGVNSVEARKVNGVASYAYGKQLVSEGQYGAATELFVNAINHHTSPVVRRLAEERIYLIRMITSGSVKAVSQMSDQLGTVRVSKAAAMHPETFAPSISFVGCPTAYRSGYDPERADPLSKLIRLIKRRAESATISDERVHAVERLGEILAAYAFAETYILRDCDYILPVPFDADR